MAYFPPTGSVVSFQSDPTKLLSHASVSGSISVTNRPSISGEVNIGNFPANQSVSGTVGASIIGLSPVRVSDGSETLDVYEENQADASVTGLAIMWKSNADTSILSTVTQATPLPVSVRGTVSVAGGNINVNNFPTSQNVSGSVVAFQGTAEWTVKSSIAGGIFPISGSVAATITNTNLNVGGSVVAFQGGTQITSLVSTVPSSVIVGASIFGLPPVNVTNTNLNIGGSVVAYQTLPSSLLTGSSIISVGVLNQGDGGSAQLGLLVVGNNRVFNGTTWDRMRGDTTGTVIQSIVGTYAEDAGHVTADKGLFVLGVRNDATASFASADLDYAPLGVDSAGRSLTKPFSADENAFRYVTSVVHTSVTSIQNSVVGKRHYITDFAIANTGSVSTLITFTDGSTSFVGHTIAPAGGGSNKEFQVPLRGAPAQDLRFQAGTAASVVYVTVTGYTAP